MVSRVLVIFPVSPPFLWRIPEVEPRLLLKGLWDLATRAICKVPLHLSSDNRIYVPITLPTKSPNPLKPYATFVETLQTGPPTLQVDCLSPKP